MHYKYQHKSGRHYWTAYPDIDDASDWETEYWTLDEYPEIDGGDYE